MTSIVLEIIMDIVCELYLYYVAYIYMLINTSSVSYMRLSLACCIYFASWKPPTFFVSLWRRLYRCLALMQWDLNISHVLYHSALFPKSLQLSKNTPMLKTTMYIVSTIQCLEIGRLPLGAYSCMVRAQEMSLSNGRIGNHDSQILELSCLRPFQLI